MKVKGLIAFALLGILLVSALACAGGGGLPPTPTPSFEHGTYLLFEIDYTYVHAGDKVDARAAMRMILQQRLYPYVVSPQVCTPDADHLYVFLPDVMSVDEARDMVGNTQQLTLKERVDDEWVVAYAEGTDGRLRAFTGAFIEKVSWAPHALHPSPSYTATVYIPLDSDGIHMIEQIAERNRGKTVWLYVGELPLLYIESPGEHSLSFVTFTREQAEQAAELIEEAALPVSLTYIEGKVYR